MNTKYSDIAVIGMSGRFPGATSVSQFWENICQGKESIHLFSDHELKAAGISETDINNSSYVKTSPILNDIDKFDPAFFKISPLEAELMDPQLRLLLQCAWELMEDAGYATRRTQNIGVFAGSGGVTTSYLSHFINVNSHFEKITASPTHLGNDKDFLATYLSYKLNLTGPSMTIQTACSTSLVALHQACSSLLNGECDMAMAGGVTIRVPHVQGYHYKDGYIFSKSGHVKTFDEAADGVVFGSGLGLVLVKKLEDAIKENDHIYAVIKGSAISNDGREKMSYAAASARGQITCITNALTKAQIAANTIGFVEAHGTGTFMGDPEEVKALSSAFKTQDAKKNYCAIGAVKTNIGHLEAAAGITGFIKAVLALHHKMIPPTLHFNKPNPRIKFENTPFFVNKDLLQWEASEYPRRAGVNSLGVGGTNAFVILEEYIAEKKLSAPFTTPVIATSVIVPLSAKTSISLKTAAEKLLHFISAAPSQGVINLVDLSYTLQLGRDAMEHRVAFVISSLAELTDNLALFLEDKTNESDAIFLKQKQENNQSALFNQDDYVKEIIQKWISEKQWNNLAGMWVKGIEFDWNEIYLTDSFANNKPHRVSLPTYDFAKERYWIDSGSLSGVASTQLLHPLLHTNTSDLNQQCYSSTFNGEEFFLKDHHIRVDQSSNQKVLPGVAYLEMARAAIVQAMPVQSDATLELRHIIWARPIIVSEPTSVSIALFASDDTQQSIEFEIYSSEAGQDIIHCQGQAVFDHLPSQASLNIAQLETQMQRGKLTSQNIYDAFTTMGLYYGPAHQGVNLVHSGENQLLAQLSLPLTADVKDAAGNSAYVLHPSLLDCALQSSVGLVVDLNNIPSQPALPFALEALRVISPCTKNMFAWARYSAGSGLNEKVIKLDIDLCDEQGNICVQLRGFSSRVLTKDNHKSKGHVLAAPHWQVAPAVSALTNSSTNLTGNLTPYGEHHILLCGFAGLDLDSLAQLLPRSRCTVLSDEIEQTLAEKFSSVSLACFEQFQIILKQKPQGNVLVQLVTGDGHEQAIFAGLSGLLKTAALENPQVVGQVVITRQDISVSELADQLQQNQQAPVAPQIRYEQGVRQVLSWQAIESDSKPMVFKDQGVYLITGGLGGLGILFAKEILAQTSKAQIILTGRSVLTADKEAVLDSLSREKSEAGRIEYRQLDLENLDQVKEVITSIQQDHQQLNGIIHSAGMNRDNFILKKTPAEFREVLSPKVTGTVNLDEATKDVDLDFVVLFSSLTSALGNLGQADYAAANGFMDQFAIYREQLRAAGQRQGKTLAINWPLWRDGGMGKDQASQDILQNTVGIDPMQAATGMRAFYQSLALEHAQTLVMEGDLAHINQILFPVDAAKPEPVAPITPVANEHVVYSGNLAEKTEDYLRKQFASLLKLPSHKIDVQAQLENYGIDSILSLDLINLLEKTFGALPKTLLFEYLTISELSEYFIKSHRTQLDILFGQTGAQPKPPVHESSTDAAVPSSVVSARRFGRRAVASSSPVQIQHEPIAIVGLSGRYPEATDLTAYWNNLRDGKDCVVEVPAERWDWREYYNEDRTQNGFHFSKWGGFIEGVDEFDPLFFNISPREAKSIDPQERLFLQHAWMAVEDAGFTRTSLQTPDAHGFAGQVGVYAGVMYGEYQLLGAEASLQGNRMGFASNLASIANRVSYVLNLHGPSMAVDTMCSSSLTAIHLACQDLKLGRTHLAIAGGVNVSIHPNKYLMLSSGQFISSDGHCQSFGEGGDGYIPGEGVGVVILKRLSDAVRDGHHIYGVIRGSALNHGGKTNGYTVPNPQAQASAISQALVDAQIDPRHISYIEAHGTGTKLGDPIEIAALTKAFYARTETEKESGFCLIGSAKSNVGHCESAAGIAGLTKVLLQMQHRQIVPSLHSAQLNPHIDFAQTPFVVNQTLRAWDRPIVDGRERSRIAGISSFGAGGSNAHVLVEEYVVADNLGATNPSITDSPVMIPLSARTAEQLNQKARDLLAFIKIRSSDQQFAGQVIDLESLAYTLQTGREAMEERLGLMVPSVEQLEQKLEAFIAGEQHLEDVYQGQVKSNKDTVSLLSGDADLQETLDKWIARKKFSKLLDLWVKGLELDWSKLYTTQPKRMSLPAYPFTKERYWIEASARGLGGAIGHSANSVLHPLVHTNTSDLFQQSYSSLFSGDEAFLKDHQVQLDTSAGLPGTVQKVLPAVAYLEMARAAVAQALPANVETTSGILELHGLVWGEPLVVNTPTSIGIAVFAQAGGQVDIEVYSDDETVHCQGHAVFRQEAAPAKLNLVQLKEHMGQGRVEAASLYARLSSSGVHYGASYQGVTAVYQGGHQLLAELNLPNPQQTPSDKNTYVLHPGLLDSALQASVALIADVSHLPRQPSLPVAITSVRIIAACTTTMFAWVRYGNDQSNSIMLDIDLCDQDGNICVQLRGISFSQFALSIENSQAVKLAVPRYQAISHSAVLAKPQAISLISPLDVAEIKNLTSVATKPNSASLINVQEVSAIAETFVNKNTVSYSPVSPVPLHLVADTQINTSIVNEPQAALSQEQLQQQLKTSLAEALYMQTSDIDVNRSFVDLGLDSIVGVEWVKVINKKYSLEISATRVYDYSTIKDLALFIEKEIEKLPVTQLTNTPVVHVEPAIINLIDTLPGKQSEPLISQEKLQQQLKASLAEALYMQTSDIDINRSFVDLGLDSIVGVEWVKVINKTYGLEISATRVYDYSSIKELALFLESEIKKSPNFSGMQEIASNSAPLNQLPAVSQTASKPVLSSINNYAALTTYPVLKRTLGVNRSFKNNLRHEEINPSQIQTSPAVLDEKIAIVGMSGRYPQASNLQEYWNNLIQGKNSISEIPQSRWDVNHYFDPDPTQKGKVYCKWLGMLDDVDCFDPLFFQISPGEAENMDPQHRLFMQESYKAFEDAGYCNSTLSNKKCGVYLGIMSNEYSLLLAKNSSTSVDTTGNSYAIGAARIAYYLNLKGPAIPIDTACSSSLVAIHLARQALLNREIDMALAGGVSLYITAESYLGMCQAGMLSPDGQCKTFDDSANGFVPGEGVGAVILKRLKDAEADNDFIYGVILASGINQDGKTNGITAPSVNSQIELERELYSRYKIHPESISYVETHGTGTKLGDPIELEALATVFSEKTSKKNFCALGAVKSNIGHTSGAAGVASVQKVLLSMQHQTLVPSLNVSKENNLFDFKKSPFYISREKQAWNTNASAPRRAGVSSFGFSGTNAHLVIEEYIPSAKALNNIYNSLDADVVIPLSARTEAQLLERVNNLIDFITNKKSQTPSEEINLTSMAYTLQVGREAMRFRLGLVVNSVEQLLEKLQQYREAAQYDSYTHIENISKGQVTRNADAFAEYGSETDLQASVGGWIAHKQFAKILDVWCKGLELDWNKLYSQTKPQRISLPAYPFAKEKYWVKSQVQSSAAKQEATEHENVKPAEKAETKQMLYYRPQWRLANLAAKTKNTFNLQDQEGGLILVLDASNELLNAVIASSENLSAASIIWVKPGDAYQQIAPTTYTVNPLVEEDFHQLLENLKTKGQLPTRILHQGQMKNIFEQDWSSAQHGNTEFFTLFHLCKAFMKQKQQTLLNIVSVCSNHSNTTNPQHTALASFFKTLSLENPKYLAKLIEINASAGIEIPITETAKVIADEFEDRLWNAAKINYHFQIDGLAQSANRHIETFTAYVPNNKESTHLPFKQNGVYLISGGLGGLGFIFSEYLAKNFRAKLVILGRSAAGTAQDEKLNQLKAYNTDILYIQTDVSKLDEVTSAVQQAKEKFSCINGVIHSAGTNKDAFIIKKTKMEVESVLNPKIYGAIHLDEATKHEKLDMFVLFSSIAGAMGNLGQCDYAYANHFLDSFAEGRATRSHKAHRFGKSLSINWPLWEEGGMSISANDFAITTQKTGMYPLPTEIGIQYLEDFIQSDLTKAIALYGVPKKIHAYITYEKSDVIKPISKKIIDTELLLQKTEDYIKALISEEIKLAPEKIDSQERFEAFGIDSMMINRFNANLERDLGALPKTLIYEYETVEELAKYLVGEVQQILMSLFSLTSVINEAPAKSALHEENKIGAEIQPAKQFNHASSNESEQIAIIGIHGSYPHSENLDVYWKNLQDGKDLIDLVPASRWDYEEFYDSNPEQAAAGKIYCKWGGFLNDFDKFDPLFFNISHDEAKIIDPQERLFIGSVWAAIEDAGYTRESLKKRYPKAKSADVGVFVGVTTNSYHLLATEEWARGNMVSPGAMPWSIANRVSYFFDFQGPSMPIDTACSSSLVAIHLACESLKRQECQIAVAGGVNLYLHPSKYQSFCQKRMLSVGGKCHSFGAGDDGFVPGEGVGTVLLKPLSKAIADQDQIYAVIAGSAFDHCGRSNGYSAPNPNSQASLISHTMARANIHPESISYIEGHGTGTQLGDSLEIAALSQAFQKQSSKKQFCAVGSVKANIGHAESAAGIAGIAKIILQMKHQQLVPSIHSDDANPNINFNDSPFYLQNSLSPWLTDAVNPRRALINSFGAGGVNACVILEEFQHPTRVQKSQDKGSHLFLLSAKNATRLQDYAKQLNVYLSANETVNPADLSYTLQVGREAMQERLAIVATCTQDLVAQLNDWLQLRFSNTIYRGSLDSGKSKNKKQADELRTLFHERELNALAELWVAGIEIPWEQLYAHDKPLRISLPTYPFAKDRYWVSDSPIAEKRMTAKTQSSQLHPLISYNSSTLKVVSFSSILSEQEFYAVDHKVNGAKIFPGAGFLEIACIAGNIAGEQRVSKINDVVWIQPLSFQSGAQRLQTFLKPIGNSTEYEVTSLDENNERIVHSEGRLFFHSGETQIDKADAEMSIESLKSQCPHPQDGTHYYKKFSDFGFDYGSSFQSIQQFHSNGIFALSKLNLAKHLHQDFDQYILHPSIIDGALQTVVGLISVETGVPYLPFALDELELVKPITQSCYAYAEFADSERQIQSDIKKFNIFILNERGEILVRLKKFYVRAFVNANQDSAPQNYLIES